MRTRLEARAPDRPDVASTEKAALFHYFSRWCVEILVGAGHVLKAVAGNQDATAALEVKDGFGCRNTIEYNNQCAVYWPFASGNQSRF